MRARHCFAVLLVLIGLRAPAAAQIPQVLSFQGALTDTLGIARPDGEYRLTFRLYADSAGGSALWQQERVVSVKRGLFTTQLGGTSTFALLFTAPRWLSVQVEGEPEIARRILLTAAAYSFQAIKSDTALVALSAPLQQVADSARIAGTVPDGAIVAQKLASNAVTTDKILDGTIVRADVAATFKAPSADTADFVHNLPPIDSARIAGTVPDGAITGSKLAANAVTTDKILDGTIQTTDVAPTFKSPDAAIADTVRRVPPTVISPGSIDSTKLAMSAVVNSKIMDGAITSSKIAPGQIVKSVNSLRDDVRLVGRGAASITSSNDTIYIETPPPSGGTGIQSLSNTNGTLTIINPTGPNTTINVRDGGIGAIQLADSSVVQTKIATGAVVNAKIAAGAVDNSKLAANAVTTTNIENGTVLFEDIGQNGAVAGQVMKWTGTGWAARNDSIGAAGVTSVAAGTGLTASPNPITTTGTISIAAGGVTNAMLAGSAVDSTKIAANSVTTAHILNNAVTNAKLALNSVASANILDGTISFQDIGQNGATAGQVMKWTGAAWAPRNDSLGTGGIGGSGATGQVAFWNSPTSVAGNSNFFWDNTNARLGLGTASPYTQLTLTGTLGFTTATTPLSYFYQSGTTNPRRSLLAHSPVFSQWGLAYNDLTDQMLFQQDSLTPVLAVGIGSKMVGINTANPEGTFDVRSGSQGIVVQSLPNINSDDITIKRPGFPSPINIRFALSQRATNTDLWLYGSDGEIFKNFLGFDFPGNLVTSPAGGNVFVVNLDSGRVGIHTRAPTEALDVTGNIRVRNMPVVTPQGDRYDVHAFPDGTFYTIPTIPEPGRPLDPRSLRSPERVLQLTPVEITWERTKTSDVILSPTETQQIIPELVGQKSEHYPDAIKYDKLTLYLLEIVKEQQREIAELRATVERLDAAVRDSERSGTQK